MRIKLIVAALGFSLLLAGASLYPAAAMAMYCGTDPSPIDPFFIRAAIVDTVALVAGSFTRTSNVQ